MSLLLALTLSAVAGMGPQQTATPEPSPAQTSETTQKPQDSSADPVDLPVSLRRIQQSLARTPRLRTASEKPVFRVEVFGRKPTIEDILGPDYLRGPVSGGAPTHQEFLSIVTPKDVAGFSAFSNGQAFMVTATAIALQWAVQRAIHKYEEAKQEHEREVARREVLDALRALQEARKKAGLPDK